MKRNTYLGIIGILSFIFGTIQLLFIISYPMIGYLIFKAAKGSYSIFEYKKNIPLVAYLLTVGLFVITVIVTMIICSDKENPEKT